MMRMRLILGYGFQEKEPEERRTRFFIEIKNQIEKCIADGIPFLWIGDCNGKLGSDIITDDINNLTPNAPLIKAIVDRKNLKVINGSTKCTRKWTRWLSNGQKSIIDFIIASDEMEEMIDSMIVDDKKEYSLFRITKNKKESTIKITKSDHCTFFC